MKTWITLLLCLAAPLRVSADDVNTIESLGWDYDAVEIRTEKVADGLYVLFGLGGNVAVSVGDQGTLIVDDMFPELRPKIVAAIEKVAGKRGVDFAINTHWHFDHAQGNLAFGSAGAWIVAQADSRIRLIRGGMIDTGTMKFRQDPYPRDGQAAISFDDRMSFHLNGLDIDLVHEGPAHTAGDAVVIFRAANAGRDAVHMGDVFNHTGYPFIDAGNGGGIEGMIAFCRAILAEVGPKAIIIPGHGEITDVATLSAYVEMLETVRARIVKAIADGKTRAEIVASKPTADLDARWKQASDPDAFVGLAHASLTRP